MHDLGETPEEEDLPPALDWEEPLWKLYVTLQCQWRVSMAGPVGLDFGTFIPVIQAKGWCVDTSMELLRVIEKTMMENHPDG